MFDDVIEAARSSRSHCRACRRTLEQGELRFGADEGGFYGDGASYSWFHLRCAAQRMPERALDAFKKVGPARLPDFDVLLDTAEKALKKAASKYPYGERAPSSRSRCLKCREAIAKGELRVAIEREIDAGTFVQTGAGYLHPACAVEQLNEPALGEVLRQNSPMLSDADKDELARLCPSATAGRAARVAQEMATAKADSDEELVHADELLEEGDPRGELIMVASELAARGIDDAKGPALAQRAKELEPAARRAWAKDIGLPKKDFRLERGFPSRVEVSLAGKAPSLPAHRWITGYRVEGVNGAAMDKLLASEAFERIRSLELAESSFAWEGYRAFCSSPAVKRLRSLDILVNVGARGVHMLLTATRFEALEELVIRSNYQATPDLRGYENVAGLRALRSLHLLDGTTAAMMEKLLGSPLVQRLEELGIHGWAVPREIPELPNLRRLRIIDGALLPPSADALVSANAAGRLPNVRRLDLTETKTDAASRKKLRAAFGERLIEKEPRPRATAAGTTAGEGGSRATSARPRARGKRR